MVTKCAAARGGQSTRHIWPAAAFDVEKNSTSMTALAVIIVGGRAGAAEPSSVDASYDVSRDLHNKIGD